MKYFCILLVAFLTACNSGATAQDIEIKNLRSGLVCPTIDGKDKSRGSICFQTQDIEVTGQGTCIKSQEKFPCTWYGFQFDYKLTGDNNKIICKAKMSELVTLVNPESPQVKDTDEFEYTLKLTSTSNHFYNPQYTIFKASSDGNPISHSDTICTNNGIELFRFSFNFIYPTEIQ